MPFPVTQNNNKNHISVDIWDLSSCTYMGVVKPERTGELDPFWLAYSLQGSVPSKHVCCETGQETKLQLGSLRPDMNEGLNLIQFVSPQQGPLKPDRSEGLP